MIFIARSYPSPIYYCIRDDDDDVERECIGGRHLYVSRDTARICFHD